MLKWIIRKGNIPFDNPKKADEFHISLRSLVTILFGVVFATSLDLFSRYSYRDGAFLTNYEFWLGILAVLAVVLSWWGYHWGTIQGPKETNVISYIVDCMLVVVYWFLLNMRDLSVTISFYLIMFILYVLWEGIRCFNPNADGDQIKRVRKAVFVNLTFVGLMIFVMVLRLLVANHFFCTCNMWAFLASDTFYTCLLFAIVLGYRVPLHYIYKPIHPEHLSSRSANNQETEKLIVEAKNVSRLAKAHLSNFRVGAAILTADGNIHVGCNIEFDNYSNTIHAEESALSRMISSGDSNPIAIAVYTASEKLNYPCGMCLQSLFEYGGNTLKVVACNDQRYESKTIRELFPSAFSL